MKEKCNCYTRHANVLCRGVNKQCQGHKQVGLSKIDQSSYKVVSFPVIRKIFPQKHISKKLKTITNKHMLIVKKQTCENGSQ